MCASREEKNLERIMYDCHNHGRRETCDLESSWQYERKVSCETFAAELLLPFFENGFAGHLSFHETKVGSVENVFLQCTFSQNK